jgi:putative membrane protein
LEVSPDNGPVTKEFAMMRWYGGGMGLLGWFAMGAFWLILIGLVVWLVARSMPDSRAVTNRQAGEPALEILNRRLASGEIDLETWQTHRAAILAAQRGVG